MTDSEIIKQVLQQLGINANQFSKNLGMKRPQGIYDIIDNKIGISKKMAEKINLIYPQFSTAWLLTGEGSMLKSGNQNEDHTVPAEKHIAALEEIIELQRRLLNKKDEGGEQPLKRAK